MEEGRWNGDWGLGTGDPDHENRLGFAREQSNSGG